MFASIYNDFKQSIRSGNMVTRIILVNVIIFVLINLVNVFTFYGNDAQAAPFYEKLVKALSVSSDWKTLIKTPWSIITHMFLHERVWHLIWNMIILYYFGRIVGDFLGDKRVLPIYLLGGLAGAMFFIGFDLLIPGGSNGLIPAYGASAAAICMLFVAATLSPDYYMHLILLGPVRIKYIALVILVLDILGTAGTMNTGGHFGHLGGAMMGLAIVYFMRKGVDMTNPFVNTVDAISKRFHEDKKAKDYEPKLQLVHVKKSKINTAKKEAAPIAYEEKLDKILDKINSDGFDKLSDEEKEFLNQASKRD